MSVPVTATLYRDSIVQAVGSSLSNDGGFGPWPGQPDGYFEFDFRNDIYGNPITILPGDEVVVEAQGAPPITVIAEPMTVAPDAAADVVNGTGPNTGELRVEVNGTWLLVDVVGGDWIADYHANSVDLRAGDDGQRRCRGAGAGPGTMDRFRAGLDHRVAGALDCISIPG